MRTFAKNRAAVLTSRIQAWKAVARISSQPTRDTLSLLVSAIEDELHNNIIPFWLRRCLDPQHGGYLVDFDASGQFVDHDRKSLIVQTRMLWFFSRLLTEKIETPAATPALLRYAADTGFQFLSQRMWDEVHGGFFWEVRRNGTGPTRTDKDAYGQAFALFALSQYALAAGEPTAKALADQLFAILESRMHDPEHGGYVEHLLRDWSPAPAGASQYSQAVGAHRKTCNVHLHLLEALTPYVLLSCSPVARERLRELIRLQTGPILRDDSCSSYESFERDWRPARDERNQLISFGHDLEGISLLIDACAAAGVPEELFHGLFHATFALAARQGVDWKSGGVFLFAKVRNPAHHLDKLWWVQAETLLASAHMYHRFHDPVALALLVMTWRFIEVEMSDRTFGEWCERVRRDGSSVRFKGAPMKAAYHNGRALLGCLRILRSEIDRESADVRWE